MIYMIRKAKKSKCDDVLKEIQKYHSSRNLDENYF